MFVLVMILDATCKDFSPGDLYWAAAILDLAITMPFLLTLVS